MSRLILVKMWIHTSLVMVWFGFVLAGCNWRSQSVVADSASGTDDGISDTEPVDSTAEPGSLTETETATFDSEVLDTNSAGTDIEVTKDSNDSEPFTSNSYCGDGRLDEIEACDDANQKDGDGCSADCLLEDPAWPFCGIHPCYHFVRCGDGNVLLPEMCDDANTESGDGCTAGCQLEIGYKCDGSPSKCIPTICGDNMPEGAETCDDGNGIPFDGCSATCEKEPDCTLDGCAAECGDGVVFFEECDDGNQINGDGCSDKCAEEEGYVCTQISPTPQPSTDLSEIEVSVIYRFFEDTHSDFDITSCAGAGEGMVASDLQQWKPVATDRMEENCVHGFTDWFAQPSYNGVIRVDKLVLYAKGNGVFENRADTGGTLSENVDSPITEGFFTTEMHYWQVYRQSVGVRMTFFARDDLWVFVNNHLAVDMGGIHEQREKSLVIDESNQSVFGLADGQQYRISLFQANRSSRTSYLRMSMELQPISRTWCTPECGDGILALGEECDDGINDGGYGECGPDCKMEAFCGDGIVQPEYEDCDEGTDRNNSDCTRTCRRCDSCTP